MNKAELDTLIRKCEAHGHALGLADGKMLVVDMLLSWIENKTWIDQSLRIELLETLQKALTLESENK